MELRFNGEMELNIKNGKEALSLIDLFEEFNLRGIEYTSLLESSLRRFDGHAQYMNASGIEDQLRVCAGKQCLFKFTKRKHLDSLKRGEVRFKLASAYNDAGFNIAIRDDELNVEHQLLNSRIVLEDGLEVPINDDLIRRSAFGDYYVACFSAAIDPKLFLMFDADVCFIIRNGEEFSKEVIKNYRAQYEHEKILFGGVGYIDPYREIKSEKPIEFLKIFDFSYESEFRFVAFDEVGNKEKVRKISIDINKIDYDIVIM